MRARIDRRVRVGAAPRLRGAWTESAAVTVMHRGGRCDRWRGCPPRTRRTGSELMHRISPASTLGESCRPRRSSLGEFGAHPAENSGNAYGRRVKATTPREVCAESRTNDLAKHVGNAHVQSVYPYVIPLASPAPCFALCPPSCRCVASSSRVVGRARRRQGAARSAATRRRRGKARPCSGVASGGDMRSQGPSDCGASSRWGRL